MVLLRVIGLLSGCFLCLFLISCDPSSSSLSDGKNPQAVLGNEFLAVYKSPTCGCCQEWINHLENAGFKTETRHPEDLDLIKDQSGIAAHLRSCHTAISPKGYVFEGHIPARYIQQFLQAPPADAFGLSVPAMPLGSPGMEVGDKFTPYQVLLLKKGGAVEVYARMDHPNQQ